MFGLTVRERLEIVYTLKILYLLLQQEYVSIHLKANMDY